MEKNFITVFTPTYNRAHTLPRVFEGLKKQTFHNFEWIIVDDGSSDHTQDVIRGFQEEKPFFPVVSRYQENSGKHVAINRAVEIAKGEFFIILDSDDTCTEDALEVFLREWEKIPEKEKFCGISCRCQDENGNIVGTPMESAYLDATELDFKLVHKIKGELWGMTRTDILRENPFPEEEGLHFYPENIYWNNLGRRYQTRYLNVALRCYINDTANAITASKRLDAMKETFFMRVHFINECWDYAKYDLPRFLLQFVGLSRDGLTYGHGFRKICAIPNTTFKRCLAVLAFPAGYLLYIRSKRRKL